MTATTTLCAVPAACWKESTSSAPQRQLLGEALRDFAVLERRVAKEVNTAEERRRYASLCDLVEQYAGAGAEPCPDPRQAKQILSQYRFPSLALDGSYVALLEAWRAAGEPSGATAPGQLGASVIVPEQVAAHLAAFEGAVKRSSLRRRKDLRRRAAFLRKVVIRHGCGVVEWADVFAVDDSTVSDVTVSKRSHWSWSAVGSKLQSVWSPALPGEAQTPPWMAYHELADQRPDFIAQQLRQQISAALADRDFFNADSQRHESLTKVMQEFVLRRPRTPPGEIKIVYSDGSEARPFPLLCVPPGRPDWRPQIEFHAALISMRHLALDHLVHVNWFTNREVPSKTSMAESDEYCYRTALERLAELRTVYDGRRVLLHLYHTGYVPAIVGFYRALVTMLRDEPHGWLRPRADWLRVLPKLKPTGSGFECGARWPH